MPPPLLDLPSLQPAACRTGLEGGGLSVLQDQSGSRCISVLLYSVERKKNAFNILAGNTLWNMKKVNIYLISAFVSSPSIEFRFPPADLLYLFYLFL